jgi:hypothetical protein
MSEMQIVLTGNKGKIVIDYDKGKLDVEYVDGRGFRATLVVPMSEVRFTAGNENFSIQYAREGEEPDVMPRRIEHRNCGGEIQERIDYKYDDKETIKERVWVCRKCDQRFDFEQFVDQARSFTSMKRPKP